MSEKFVGIEKYVGNIVQLQKIVRKVVKNNNKIIIMAGQTQILENWGEKY